MNAPKASRLAIAAVAVASIAILVYQFGFPTVVAPRDAARPAERDDDTSASGLQREVPGRLRTTAGGNGVGAGWTPVDEDSVEGSRIPPYKEVVAGRVLVSLSKAMRGWQTGDVISLPVPQAGHTYTPVIDRVETLLGNNRSYSGRLVAEETPYSFVITVGDRNTFANLSTPTGQYELVGNTELAWLMPVASMDQHVDYSQPDYVISEAGADGP